MPEDFENPIVDGLDVPGQLYWAKVGTPPLAGMQLPAMDTPWLALHNVGFRWIVCLCSEHPRYDPDPIERLVSVELADLAEREFPEDPELEERAIRIIAEAVLKKLDLGEGVVVHCAGGRGRTGTVLGVALVRLGSAAEVVVNYLDRIHQARGKPGWPESPWQSDLVLRTESRQPTL